MTQWWAGIPAAAARIDCGGHAHTLRWRQGALEAVDHDSVEAEGTLAALARETVPCLERVRAWNRYRDDVRVLTLASRGLGDPLDVPAARHPHPRMPAIKPTDGGLGELLALGGGLADRLQAHAAATWAERLRTEDAVTHTAAMPQLHAALYGRLLATLRSWLDEPELSIELEMVEPGGDRWLRREGHVVAVALPFEWLAEVWTRGLSTIVGRLCLAAGTDDGVSWTLDTAEPDLVATTRLTITVEQPAGR